MSWDPFPGQEYETTIPAHNRGCALSNTGLTALIGHSPATTKIDAGMSCLWIVIITSINIEVSELWRHNYTMLV